MPARVTKIIRRFDGWAIPRNLWLQSEACYPCQGGVKMFLDIAEKTGDVICYICSSILRLWVTDLYVIDKCTILDLLCHANRCSLHLG